MLTNRDPPPPSPRQWLYLYALLLVKRSLCGFNGALRFRDESRRKCRLLGSGSGSWQGEVREVLVLCSTRTGPFPEPRGHPALGDLVSHVNGWQTVKRAGVIMTAPAPVRCDFCHPCGHMVLRLPSVDGGLDGAMSEPAASMTCSLSKKYAERTALGNDYVK